MRSTLQIVALSLIGGFVLASTAGAVSWTDSGTLTYAPNADLGLNASNGNWKSTGSSLEWSVAWDDGAQRWDYAYTLIVAGAPGISHFILNLSVNGGIDDDEKLINPYQLPNNVYASNPFEFTPSMDNRDGAFDYQWYSSTAQGNSNPGMPAGFFGIKGDVDEDTQTVTMTITTTRQPMWGHFYAKGGNGGIWNSGLEDDVDQALLEDYLNNDYSASHLLVPNSHDDDDDLPPVDGVPEPMTALALLGSLGGLGGYLRKRRNG